MAGIVLEEKYYHVTMKRNLKPISQNGLIPKIGKRSRAAGEKVPAVYLFYGMDAVKDAVDNWLGEEMDGYSDKTDFVLLGISDSDDIFAINQTAGYEAVSFKIIPPGHIQYLGCI